MKKVLSKFKSILPSKRRLIQLYAALLFNANLKGFVSKNPNASIYGGPVKNVCTPGLNCYSCPGASGACPLGSLQNALASSGKSAPYYVFGIILLYGIIFGRFICGFLCPFGLIQDLLHKIPTPKFKKNKFTKALSYLKYVILAFFVFVIPLLYMLRNVPLPAFCKFICPAGTLGGAVAMLINPTNNDLFSRLGPLFTWKFALLVSFIVGCVFIYRLFCRFICPLGALYGLFNRFAILGIKLDKPSCTECGRCIDKCKMDISRVGDHECINCGECISVCPTNAIQWRGGKIILPKNDLPASADEEQKAEYERRRKKKSLAVKITAAILALSLLGGALVYYNFFDKVSEEAPPTVLSLPDEEFTSYPFGKDFSIKGIDGVTLIAFIGTNDADSDARLAVLNELVSAINQNGEAEDPWCKVVVIFDGCEINATPLLENLANPSLIVTGDDSGEYREKLVFLTGKDGFFIVSRNDLITEVKAKDTTAEDLKFAAFLANTDASEGVNEGNLCPTYTLPIIPSGGTVNLADLKGKTVVLNFWYTDCTPCVEELPEFNEVAVEYKDKDVVFIAVHQYSSLDKATKEYFDEQGWSDWEIIFAADGEGEAYFKGLLKLGAAWPSTLVIDARGVIHKKFTDKVSKEQLTSALDSAIEIVEAMK